MLFNFDLELGILEHSGNRNPELPTTYSILLTLQNDDRILDLTSPLRFDRRLLLVNLLGKHCSINQGATETTSFILGNIQQGN